MRGTHADLDPLRRGVMHALEQAEEDVFRWCAKLTEEQMFARISGLPSVAFHLRHMARSLDRLMTYAADGQLNEGQLAALESEMDGGVAAAVLLEFAAGIRAAKTRVEATAPATYGEARGIGRKRLPTTVGGVLIHCAEHTQRHVGQMVTTCKIVAGK